MNIYIPIEVKARELEGRLLLALVAAERGHSVIIGGKEDTIGLAARGWLAPGIIHEKCLTPYEQKLAPLKRAIASGHKITSQDEEYGLIYKDFDKFMSTRFSVSSFEVGSKIFCWGSSDKNFLKKRYSNYAEKIALTGSPRVDFWRPDMPANFSGEKARSLAAGSGYLLVTSNFGTIFNVNRFWNIVEMNRLIGIDRSQEINTYENAAYQYLLAFHFVKMIRSLAESFPSVHIVVRPHPVEDMSAWATLIGEVPNVSVIREGAAINWIKNSRAVIHNGCTSGLEAAVAGVPRIAYRPVRSPHEITIPNDVSYPVDSLEELHGVVESILTGKSFRLPPQNEAKLTTVLSERLAGLNGQLAADRIVDEWEALDEPRLRTRNNWVKLFVRQLASRSRANLKALWPARPKLQEAFVTKHKFPYLLTEEISDLVSRFQADMNRFSNVKWKRFGRRSFVIHN